MNHVALRPEFINILSLCTGGGGLDLGVDLAMRGARTVCMVEREAFAASHLGSNDCACSATALSRYRQRMRCELSARGLPGAAAPAQLGLFV